MKKKFSVLCSVIAIFALIVTVMGVKLPMAEVKTDASTAVLEQYYDDADDMNTTLANEPADTTASSGSSLGGLGDLLGGLGGSSSLGGGILDGIGGIGGIFGDAGDVIGSVIGGTGSGSSGGVVSTTKGGNDYVLIDPVPAATQSASTVTTTAPSTSASTTPVEDTMGTAATSNPYVKPVTDVNVGDMGDGVKWMQWIFVYTGYGLADGKITGIYDGETVELVKKLQAERGLTADGVVNDATIDKIELLYYEYILTAPTTLPDTTAEAITTVGASTDGQDDGGTNWLVIVIAVLLIVLVWAVAIVVIVILLIKSKKTKKAEAAKLAEEAEKPDTAEISNEMNLSDLFEEANSKKK